MARRGEVDEARAAEFRRAGWWGDASLYDYWSLSLAAHPDKTAVVDAHGVAYTYSQVQARAARVAAWLRAQGVTPGDVVSVQVPNWSDHLVITVACLRVGAVLNPVLTNHRLAELTQSTRLCATTVLVMPTRFKNTDYRPFVGQVLGAVQDLRAVLLVEHPADAGAGASDAGAGASDDDPRVTTLARVLAATEPLPEGDATPTRGTDVAAILFTSGSEAAPKGVLLSHDNLLCIERSYAYELGIGFPDRIFMPAPLAHATGFMHGVTLTYVVGATLVLLDVVTGEAAVAMINAHDATCGQAAPSVVQRIFDACDAPEDLTGALRFFCCGGSPVPRQLVAQGARFGVRLYSVYGSTESAPHTLTTASDSDERVVCSDGRAVVGMEVRIVDPETRATLPPGVEGEEASRGPAVFLGYLDRPDLTAAVLDADGWYYSGDLAVMDADGYIRITGRRKNVIIRGGENISATEVEDIVRDMPGVADVAVVAMPNDAVGECACAYLVMREGARPLTVADMRAFFIARGVAKYKIPEWVEYLDELPRSPAGKVRKGELRAQIAALVEVDKERAAWGLPPQPRRATLLADPAPPGLPGTH